jgi:plasmid stabilization system protein ParE
MASQAEALMSTLYELSVEAQDDIFEIWSRIASDSVDLANRIESEFHELFASLGRMPRRGHKRTDLTKRPVLFSTLYSFVVVYQPDVKPIRIMAVLRGKRNVKRVSHTTALMPGSGRNATPGNHRSGDLRFGDEALDMFVP